MNKNIFKAVDIRGLYPEEINEQSTKIVAKALAQILPAGKIIIAHDVRHGSPEIAKVVEQTIKDVMFQLEKKFEIENIGLASTPMFYFIVNHLNAVGGCMITASHNPKNYNGMKIVSAGAELIPGLEILKYIENNNII